MDQQLQAKFEQWAGNPARTKSRFVYDFRPSALKGYTYADPETQRAWEAFQVGAVLFEEVKQPIPMILFCPACRVQHIDEPKGDWNNPPHRKHLCANCGTLWKPSNLLTTGVAVLPDCN